MVENDILQPLFNLHPLIVSSIIWLLGFGSLVLVALKTKSLKVSVLRNPGVIIGDFFLLPCAAYLITKMYQNIQPSVKFLSSPYWNLVLIPAVILALISAIRFNHKSLWWLPHNIFYFLMSFIVITFALKGIFQVVSGGDVVFLIIYLIILILTVSHQLLGVIFPKRFPSIE